MIEFFTGFGPMIYAIVAAAIGAVLLWARRSGVKSEQNKRIDEHAKTLERIANVEDSFTVDDARARLSKRK